MMRYEDNVTAITIQNILEEELPKAVLVNAVLIANVCAWAIKHMNCMKRDKEGKLVHNPTISDEEADTIIRDSTADAKAGKMYGKDLQL